MSAEEDFMTALRNYAKIQGGVLLSTEFLGRAHPYKWVCFKGHVFIKTYWELKDYNRFCKQCRDIVKNN